jgi:hypothetical protein
MTVGTHSVVVYADRNAAQWGTPIVSNPYFTVNATGWGPQPFGTAPVWVGGTLNMPTGGAIHRDGNPTYATPRKAGNARYRVRATFTVNSVTNPRTNPPNCQVFLHLYVGRTHADASQGNFWRPNDAADVMWTALNAGLGTHTLELEVTVPASFHPEYQFLGVAIQFTDYDGSPNTSTDTIEVQYRSEGGQADISCLLDEVTIVQGRPGPAGQPEAAAATLDLTTGPGAPLPALVDTGAVILVTTSLALADGSSVESVRFIGRITDVALGWEANGPDTPDTGVGQVVAVGLLADLARRVVGSTPFPQELDAARVARVLDLAGLPPAPTAIDPGTVQVLPRDIDSRAALEVIQDVATSANGILWETRGGELRYADSEHRRNVRTFGVVLDACDVDVTPTWTRTLEGLVNQVSIGYGDTPDEGEQPRYLAEAPASVTTWGRYNYSLGSELAALADATALGQLLLARNSSPVWNLSGVPVNADDLDPDVYRSLLALEMHSLVNLTGMPAIGTTPTSAAVWLEGWTERLAWGVHTFELALSGYCRTAPPPRWDDLNPGATWDTMAAAVTWDSAACLGPTSDFGRWDDVPATLRWDDLAPAVTWNSWTVTPTTAAAPAPDERTLSWVE